MAIKSDENLGNLTNIFSTGEENLVNEAIISLRMETPFKGAVRLVADYYDKTENQDIRKNIETFFNDIKESSLREEIVDLIKMPYKTGTTAMIVASCWQSGLDYSGFVMDFATLFFSADYRIALECMTVIEELVDKIDPTSKKKLSTLIKTSKNAEKSGLTSELSRLLENKSFLPE